MKSVFKDHRGKFSAMRLGFCLCLGAGALLVVSGVIAMFTGHQGAETAMATGAGMMTGSGFAKALQAAKEHANPHTLTDR